MTFNYVSDKFFLQRPRENLAYIVISGGYMARPINPNPPIHTDKTLRKRWDGRYYVLERKWQYNHSMKGNKHLSSVVIGVIENKSDPIESMIPIEEWNKRRQAEKEFSKKNKEICKHNNKNINLENYNNNNCNDSIEKIDIKAPSIIDNRQLERIAFPADCLFLIMLGAFSSGYTDCQTCEAYYNVRRNEFVERFNNFPDIIISHDTFRRFLILLGKDKNDGLLAEFNKCIIENICESKNNSDDNELDYIKNTRVIATDGQAVRATKIHSGSKHARSVLSFYDCKNNIVLEQCVVGEKTNEIPHALQLIEKVDISGAVITADALHTQYKFIQKIIALGGDYVIPVKTNQSNTSENIRALFRRKGAIGRAVKISDSYECGHDRIAERIISVLPAHYLDDDTLDKWSLLREGCIVKQKTIFTRKSTGKSSNQYRYFISSLHFDEQHIAERLLYIIKSHWKIENKLHWVLDVVYSQDRTQCKNSEFFKGITLMMKIMNNFVEAAKIIEENETGKSISKSMLTAKLSNFSYFYKMYTQILCKSTT